MKSLSTYNFRRAGLFGHAYVIFMIVVTPGTQVACLPRALVVDGLVLEALLLRQGGPRRVHRLAQEVQVVACVVHRVVLVFGGALLRRPKVQLGRPHAGWYVR